MNILLIYPHGNAFHARCGGSARALSIVNALVKNDFNVSILHTIQPGISEDKNLKNKCDVYYYRELSFYGIPDWYFTDLNLFFILNLFKIIRKTTFDIIQIEFPWGFLTTRLLAKKKTLVIYDSIGVESEFMEVSMKNPKFPKIFKPFAKILVKYYEKLVCKLADFIINVSELDRNYYIKEYKINKNKTMTINVPSIIRINEENHSENLKIAGRNKLGLPNDKTIVVFHGSFDFAPNQEALSLIKNQISLKLNFPDILYVIAGSKIDNFKENNIISLGFVENLEEFLYAADFAIVPLISGGGMRVKCMDYIAAHLPFVTTKKGIEGIEFLKNKIDCLIYDTVDENFINGIYKLYNNKELRQKIRNNLMEKSSLSNLKTFEQRLIRLYEKILKRNADST